MEDLQHRLAAVWFADVVGYTRQAAADEEQALRVVRSLQEAARDVTRRYEGRIVKFIGDAVLAEFASTEAAVRAALRLKTACVERARHAGVECPTLRIGVHVGDVTMTADGDLYGDGVNLASRIVDNAEPGEVWVSQDVWRQLRHRPRFEFAARGAHTFEGFDAVDVYAVSGEEGAESMVGRLGAAARARALVLGLRRHPAIPAAALVLSGAVVAWMLFGQERSVGVEPRGEAGATAEVEPGSPSRIAVLYFDDRSEGHYADGLTETLIHDLSQVQELDVISREGVRRYRDVPLDSLVRALGVGTLVEGSVDQSGDLVRVTARLIDATDMTQLASIRVEQPRGELFALQDSLVAEVSRGLRRQLGQDIRLDLARRAAGSVEAYELVQRATKLRDQAWEARSDTEVAAGLRQQADSILARAEELDGRWIEPILLRGQLALETGSGEALQRGLGHAGRAMALPPRDVRAPRELRARGRGHGLRGSIQYALARQASDSLRAAQLLDRAERDLRTAVTADPSLASAWIALADLLYNAKWELAAARDAARRAYEEDVFLLEEDHFVWLCEISMQLGDYPAAWRWCAEGRRRAPSRQRLPMVELVVLASGGVPPDPAAAWKRVDELAQLRDAEYNVPVGQMVTAAVLARGGLRDSALAVAGRARASVPSDYALNMAYLEAYVRFVLGDRDTALRLLREFLTGYPPARSLVARDYWFEDLAGDPRFEALVDRPRLPFFCQILCEPPPP